MCVLYYIYKKSILQSNVCVLYTNLCVFPEGDASEVEECIVSYLIRKQVLSCSENGKGLRGGGGVVEGWKGGGVEGRRGRGVEGRRGGREEG